MPLKCLVLDDEPLACKFLEDCIEQVEVLELIQTCTSPLKAMEILRRETVDVLFLDIQMPELTGLELLATLQNPPRVVMTTAYDEFAVESYNYNVVDYLLKPFDFARFLKAVNKLTSAGTQTQFTPGATEARPLEYIYVNNNGAIERLELRDIYFIKGMGDYVGIRTTSMTMLVRDNLKNIEQLLSASNFMRVHKSYIVALSKIESVRGNVITIQNESISVGALYRQAFLQELNRLKIG